MGEATLDLILEEIKRLHKRFDEHDRRFDEHDKRFDEIDRRFAEHDKRFDVLDKRLAEHDKRFDGLERSIADDRKAIIETLASIDSRLDMLTLQNEQLRTDMNDLRVRQRHLTHKVADIEADVAALGAQPTHQSPSAATKSSPANCPR